MLDVQKRTSNNHTILDGSPVLPTRNQDEDERAKDVRQTCIDGPQGL